MPQMDKTLHKKWAFSRHVLMDGTEYWKLPFFVKFA
jgi:hypothetical protein